MAKATGTPATLDVRLREMDLGVLSGKRTDEADALGLEPEQWWKVYYRVPGGESVLDHHLRVAHFYLLLDTHHGTTVCCVARGGGLVMLPGAGSASAAPTT